MSRRRRLLMMPGVFKLPYSVDFSGYGDGPLPYPWQGSTFAISSGVVVNTPGVGANLLTGDPGLETAYTAGLNGYIDNAGTTPTNVESADAYGGVKAQQFTADAINECAYFYSPVINSVVGNWYRWKVWAKRTVGTGTNVRTRLWLANSIPGIGGNFSYPIKSTTYAQNKHSLIATSVQQAFPYGALQVAASNYDTVIFDDGILEVLTYSTLFSMIKKPVSRLATVKVKPNTLADATLSFSVMWANASASPSTYLMAWYSFRGDGIFAICGLIKCVAGTYTQLITETLQTIVANAWLEIRPTDDDTVGLYYNNTQVGTDQNVANVPGSYCGFGITGGNNVKSFFVG